MAAKGNKNINQLDSLAASNVDGTDQLIIWDAETSTTKKVDISSVASNIQENLIGGTIYRGTFNGSTGSPSLPTGSDVLGDFYRVTEAGSGYAVGDALVFNGTSYDHIAGQDLPAAIKNSGLKIHDIYVKADYTGAVKDGSVLYPFDTIEEAISSAEDGDSIYVEGAFTISSQITLPTDKSLFFYGSDDAEIAYASYNTSNGSLFFHMASAALREFKFKNITFKNAGAYGLYIHRAAKVEIDDCVFENNGWDGTQLHTILPSALSTVLGYDSTPAELQAFYAGPNASNGGAMRLQEIPNVLLSGNVVRRNLRGIRIQDCGINGGGFITRNQASENIESGIYLAAGALGGSQNMTVGINVSAYNANNGLLSIGGLNNKFSQNEVKGNWNAGACFWGSANATLRDCGLYDNNRSYYNGIGNTGDAKASVQINDAFGLLNDFITVHPDARYIAEILDTQVHYTGLGSNTVRIGLLITEEVGNLTNNDKNIIKIDDVGFIGQDNCIDLSEVDLSNLTVALGDNSFITVGEVAVKQPLSGQYYELPYSNHTTDLNYADFSVDAVGNLLVKEGPAGARLNPYRVNDLQASAFGSKIKVVLKDSNKIQFTVPVAGCTIDGAAVNSVLSLALVQLNDTFTNTVGFTSGNDPVQTFNMVDDEITLGLESGASYSVDVTTLGVDENKFVASGALSGTDLVLTMSDGSTISIDATNMINGSTLQSLGQGWFYAFGQNEGDELTSPTTNSSTFTYGPQRWGQKLRKGFEFIWTQYHLPANGSYYFSIGTWAGDTSTHTNQATFVTNWTTKFGFYYNNVMRDTSDFVNGGYSSKNTDITGSEYIFSSGAVMRLVYGDDNHLRLYADDVLVATTVVAESGDDLDIFIAASAPPVELPTFIERTSTWEIVHDFDSSEVGIGTGIEDDTVLESRVSIEPGEKAMINLDRPGLNSRFGLGYTGAATGNSNAFNDITSAMIYGTSEQLVRANVSDWDWNTSAVNYNSAGNGKWTRGSALNAGMVSIRYHADNSVDLYSESFAEVIATRVSPLDGSPLKITFGANATSLLPVDIPTVTKQTIGQGYQPVTVFAPSVPDQSFNLTELEPFNVKIELDADSNVVSSFSADNLPSWASLNQATGEITGTAPLHNTSSDTYVILCKGANAIGGITNFTVTLEVLDDVYANTKSLKFGAGSDAYLAGNPAGMPMIRNGVGGGASDAWAVSFWLKRGASYQPQELFYFGGKDRDADGAISLRLEQTTKLRFTYGSNSEAIAMQTLNSSNGFGAIDIGTGWHHVVINYRGNPTGAGAPASQWYANSISITIDGVLQPIAQYSAGDGYGGSILPERFTFGDSTGNEDMLNVQLNQIAIWNSDQILNAATIYNSGATQDLRDLADPPSYYYEMGDSVSNLTDLIGGKPLVGYNFASSDIVTDAP